jgi:hypothetical protein
MKSAVGWGAAWGAASLLASGCLGAGTLGEAPANGRCGATPRLLVSASSYPVTPGATDVHVSAIAVEGSDVFYVLSEWGGLGPTANDAGSGAVTDPQSDGGFVIPSGGSVVLIPQAAGAVMRVPVAGGQPEQIAGGYMFGAPALTSTSMILAEANVVDGGVSGGAIVLVPRDGSPPTTLAATSDWLVGFGRPPPVTDGTSVYYVDELGVEVIPASPDSAGAKPTLVSSESPFSLGILGQRLVLFTSEGAESLPLGSSDAATETALATGLPDGTAADVAACGNNACWLEGDTGVLQKIDPAGGPPRTIANLSGQLQSTGNVVFDGTTFFIEGTTRAWNTGSQTATIVKVPGQGGPSVPLVTGGGALAVDDACVYFASSSGIFSLAKTAEGAVVQ